MKGFKQWLRELFCLHFWNRNVYGERTCEKCELEQKINESTFWTYWERIGP